MNYEKLTRRLIQSCVERQNTAAMDAVLPSYACFNVAIVELYDEHGGPAYEELLDEMSKNFAVMVESELNKGENK